MAIYRTFSKEILELATRQVRDELKGFDPTFWATNNENIALADERGNVSLFEHVAEGVVNGHYFFLDRGVRAVEVATAMINYLFKEFPIEVIRGLTPHDKKGARWMNRKLGFTEYGPVDTEIGTCEIVILTKAEWKALGKKRTEKKEPQTK